MSRDPSRPTVVVADDHRRMLDAVSNLLTEDFCLVAAVTDGRQAVDAVKRLDPDIAVLDITMPELDGFRTAQALRRAGARAEIVFLTLHDADEYVEAALKSGAKGYVLKARMEADLSSALRHALAGRSFLPSLTSLSTMAGDAGGHHVHFRGNDGSFHDSVVELLFAAIARGEMAVVLGTTALHSAIAGGLQRAGCDVAAARASGSYLEFDAVAAISQVLRNGLPDRGEVANIVQDLERRRLARRSGVGCRLTLFGEMAGLLMEEGNVEAAIRLEQIWNELTRTLPYLTICSYTTRTVRSARQREAICAEHSAVCHAARLQ